MFSIPSSVSLNTSQQLQILHLIVPNSGSLKDLSLLIIIPADTHLNPYIFIFSNFLMSLYLAEFNPEVWI